MKTIKNSNLLLTSIIMLAVFSIITLTGCEEQKLTTDKTDILESIEYQEYLSVYLNLTLNSQNKFFKKQKIGEINGRSVYLSNKKSNTNGLKELSKKYLTLLDRFPKYECFNNEEKRQLFEDYISNKIFIKENAFSNTIRLKSANTEADDAANAVDGNLPEQFDYETFDNYEDALDAIREYGDSTNFESGGFLFDDNSAIVFFDENATDSTMSMPIWDNGASESFHYHPAGTPTMSGADSIAYDVMSEYGVENLTIVTNDSTYTYSY